ncbi:MAG: S41 family peptidase [Bacteroidota bacterium]
MKTIGKTKWIVGLILVGAVVLFSFSDKDDFKISKSLDIYHSLFRELNIFYVEETNPEELIETSIEAMLESLDPYTKYIPEKDMEDFKFMTTGDYGGVGAMIREEGDFAVISQPYKDFPADKAGLKTGDVIRKINGESIKGWELEKVSDELKGIPETKVKITIDRVAHEEPIVKEVVRDDLHINSVAYQGMADEEKGIGYIRISKFTKNAGQEVKDAYKSLNEQHDLNGMVLDLRNNPGGLLMEAVNVANIFIPKGKEIVSTKGKIKKWNETYTTQNRPLDTNIRLTVLVNRISASASEIVAGAIQDYDRGVVIGQRTFGKGLVQTTRSLSYNSKLKVTTAKYYIPSGRSIQAKDYSTRNEDGSVGEIPDSLIKEFTTNNGRKVYDGGGIRPDIFVEPRELSKIEASLLGNNLIFDFATHFSVEHDTIPPVDQYEVNESTYSNFQDFVMEKSWDYTTRSQEKLSDLIETAKKEKYYDQSKSELNELKEKLTTNEEKDLERFKSSIKQLLEEEIAGRYYYQRGKIKANLEDDSQYDKSLEVVNDEGLYTSILTGEYERDNIKLVKE